MSSGIATFIRELQTQSGYAALYRVDPPVSEVDYGRHVADYVYVVVHSYIGYRGRREIKVAPASCTGSDHDSGMTLLLTEGRMHHLALRELGYEMAVEPLKPQ